MTSDLQALLAAIVANPSDDVARLVYADCLEEHGNAPRAQFIRLQVEAEHHHPDSNARGTLEAEARALFDQHWQDWWADVCANVGLPASELHYSVTGYAALTLDQRPVWPYPPENFPVAFRRGFPESVAVPALIAGAQVAGSHLAHWPTVSPLTELTAVSATNEPRYAWPEGPHLETVRRLALYYHDRDTLRAALASPHPGAVDHLTLVATYGYGANEELFPDDLGDVLASQLTPRLKHLSIANSSIAIVELLAHTAALAGLESLRLPVSWFTEYPEALVPSTSLDALARAPQLAGLRKLALSVYGNPEAAAPFLQSPEWGRLTHLQLDFGRGQDQLGVFRRQDALASLEEFRLGGSILTAEAVRHLARSPMLKRVKHFALGGVYNDGRALLPLVDVVDPARIETFALQIPYFPERAANALRAKFGDRVRFLPV